MAGDQIILKPSVSMVEMCEGIVDEGWRQLATRGGRAGGKRVVQHVRFREWNVDACFFRVGAHCERHACMRLNHVAREEIGLGAFEAASRALVSAQLPVLPPFVDEQRITSLAHACIRHGVLRQAEVFFNSERDAFVLDKIGYRLAQGIVRIVDKRRMW